MPAKLTSKRKRKGWQVVTVDGNTHAPNHKGNEKKNRAKKRKKGNE